MDQTRPTNDSCVTWTICGAIGSGNNIYSQCLNCLFVTKSFWSDTFLSLDIVDGPCSCDMECTSIYVLLLMVSK